MPGWLSDRYEILVLAPLAGLAVAAGAAFAPLAFAAALVAIGLIALVFARAKQVLLVFVAVLPWEGALKVPTETITVVKLFGVLLVLAWIVRAVATSAPLRLSPTFVPVGILGLVVGLSLVALQDPVAGLPNAIRYALYIAFFFLVVQLVETKTEVVNLLRVYVLSTGAAAVYALVLFLQGTVERAAGPIEDPNDFAFVLVATMPFAGYLIARDRRARWLWILCLLALFGAAMATFSRGGLVGLLAIATWAVLARRIPVAGLLAAGLGLLLVLALGFAAFSPLIKERLELKSNIAQYNVATRDAYWDAAVRMSFDEPLLGIGPGQFAARSSEYVRDAPLKVTGVVVHNSYLEILAEDGYVALAAFIAFLGGSWLLLRGAYADYRARGDPDAARLVTTVQAALIAACVSGFFLSVQLATPYWLIGALACVLSLDGARAVEPAGDSALVSAT